MSTESTAGNPTRAWVEVDLAALVRNGRTLANLARVPLLPMVKADAYGVGVAAVVRALDVLDPAGFGVATLAEGVALREAGVRRPVLVFTPMLVADLRAAHAASLTPTLSDPASIVAWSAVGGAWHLAIDTGMHRAGVRWDRVAELLPQLAAHPPLGAFTHFHSAEVDDDSMATQELRFRDALRVLESSGVSPSLRHTDNSAAIVRRAPSPWSLVRPGVFLYGVSCGGAAPLMPAPVVSLRAPVADLRDVFAGESVSYGASWTAHRHSRVATLAIGYADGYRRSLGNRGTVLLHGRRAPVVGTVTMDMTMIDVTGLPCQLGDVATLIGRDGDDTITVNDVANACGFSPYEVLTGLASRAQRRVS